MEPILQDYIDAWAGLDRKTFIQQIGVPVLISKAYQDYMVFQSEATKFKESEIDTQPIRDHETLNHRQQVFEIRKIKPGPTHQITVGRSEDNDLVIHDETVSAQHALFLRDIKTSITQLQDRESTNGTRVNGAFLLPGRTPRLQDGDRILFGDAEFFFYSPGGLYDELSKMFESKSASK